MTAGFVQPPEWVSFIFSRSPDCHVYICTLNTSPRRWFWMVLESGSAENGHESEQTTCLHGELISIPKTELISRPPHKEHCDQRSRQNHHHPGAVGMISSHGNAIPKFADDPPLKTLEDGPISGIESGESGESEDQSEDLLQKRDASDDVFAIASRSWAFFGSQRGSFMLTIAPDWRQLNRSMDWFKGQIFDGFRLRKNPLSQSIDQPHR